MEGTDWEIVPGLPLHEIPCWKQQKQAMLLSAVAREIVTKQEDGMERRRSDNEAKTWPIRSAWMSRCLLLLILVAYLALFALPAQAQVPDATPTPTGEEEVIEAPESVDVQPTARDEEIRVRLQGILDATGWFVNPEVQVEEGVVFLRGEAEREEYKTWAGDLARRTQDVTAVVNQFEILEPSVWDFSPVVSRLQGLGREVMGAVPIVVFGLLVLLISWVAARLTAMAARRSLQSRDWNPLLINVVARGVGLIVLLIGLYVVFQVAGLTSAALTIVGGTGLLGIILGIAFREITENFLASIILSVQTPFQSGDLVEIDGVTGFVQGLTTRATILMTQDGNHVQIPNATVYTTNIHNYTSNPNRREDFVVGIAYTDSVVTAQEVALKVLEDHPAVLDEPEPWVLVESLGSATINLRIYFWLDGSQYSWQKVRSSIIRLVKGAYQAAGIEMPGETRELILPDRIPVELLQTDGARREPVPPHRHVVVQATEEPEMVSTEAEAGLHSDAEEIQEQARRARVPEEGENLLKPSEP
jgi:small conductance mechanosensitive channel